MTKRAYYRLCLAQPRKWLEECAAKPSDYMSAMQVRLVRLAARRKIAEA